MEITQNIKDAIILLKRIADKGLLFGNIPKLFKFISQKEIKKNFPDLYDQFLLNEKAYKIIKAQDLLWEGREEEFERRSKQGALLKSKKKPQKEVSDLEKHINKIKSDDYFYIGHFPKDGSNDSNLKHNVINEVECIYIDYINHKKKIIIWADGCTHHGCPTCKKYGYRGDYIEHLRKRHRQAVRAKKYYPGYKLVSIWGHEGFELSTLDEIVKR